MTILSYFYHYNFIWLRHRGGDGFDLNFKNKKHEDTNDCQFIRQRVADGRL